MLSNCMTSIAKDYESERIERKATVVSKPKTLKTPNGYSYTSALGYFTTISGQSSTFRSVS